MSQTTFDQAQAVWKPVPGWTHYEVSDMGQVRSLRFDPPKVICARKRGGYLYVQLHLDGVKTDTPVHRLVASVFLSDQEGSLVRHLNGDPYDNRKSNLAWGTQSDNMFDMVRHGRNVQAKKTRCIRDHEFTEENTIRFGPDNRWRRCRTCDNTRKRVAR